MTSARALIIAVVVMAYAIPTWAQRLGTFVPIEDPTGSALDRFHQALQKAEHTKSRVRLSFYGDSHTSEDRYTSFLRQGLQARFGDGGPGFVMPVEPFPYYSHQGLIISDGGLWKTLRVRGRQRQPDAYGLAGFAVETTKKTWGAVELRRRAREVTRFDVFYLKQPRGGSFDVLINGKKLRTLQTASTKREPGFASIEFSGRRLEIRTHGDGRVRIFGASLERGSSGVIVDALGIPSAKGRDQLPWDQTVHGAHLNRIAPDLLVLEYGTNESGGDVQNMTRYERDLRALLSRMRKLQPNPSCLLLGPSEWPELRPDGAWRSRKRTLGIRDVQRKVAPDFGCAFFDTLAFMGGPGSMVRWVDHAPPLALSDYVHFTDEGYRRLGTILEQALMEGFHTP